MCGLNLLTEPKHVRERESDRYFILVMTSVRTFDVFVSEAAHHPGRGGGRLPAVSIPRRTTLPQGGKSALDWASYIAFTLVGIIGKGQLRATF